MRGESIAVDDLSLALVAERPRLVSLCRRMTGSSEAAEDLAQETLLEAWRLLDRLREREGLRPWLDAIARNVCRRWASANGRERAHLTLAPLVDDPLEAIPAPLVEDDDPTEQVERAEVSALLERALAILPDDLRAFLRASLIAETPTADLARTYGLSEGAVRVRLHRGRQALRRLLSSELRAEAEALGLALPAAPDWMTSRIWCPFCGASYLRYRIDRTTGDYSFLCAGECAGYSVAGSAVNHALVEQVRSPKSLLARHCLELATGYRAALAGAENYCQCGATITFIPQNAPDVAPGSPTPYGIIGVCPNCGLVDRSSAWHLALDTIEAQRFWRRYPRIRALPMKLVERDNRAAIVTGFAAVGSAARLCLVSDASTYSLLHVETHGEL